MKKLHVIPDETGKITSEIMAKSIIDIAEGIKKLRAPGGINDKAIVLLISESSGVSRTDVRNVMYAMENLKKEYIRV